MLVNRVIRSIADSTARGSNTATEAIILLIIIIAIMVIIIIKIIIV
jgi:hypothetical protein